MDTPKPWSQATHLIERIAAHPQADSFHISLLPSDRMDAGVFGRDNWMSLQSYWREFLELAEIEGQKLSVILLFRQFTKLRTVGSDLPLQKMAAAILNPMEVVPIGREVFKKTVIDHKTGKPIRQEPTASYMDFSTLLRQLNIEL